MASIFTIITVVFGLSALSGFHGVRIERLDVPLAVRNGSGPIELTCIYDIGQYEMGLVVNWYHENEQIYQWLPPMKPQDRGVIAGFTLYTIDTLIQPETHSIIHLKEVNVDMSGEYTCSVATFVSSDVSVMKKMIIYVPEDILTIQALNYNETHLNLVCLAIGAHPLPVLSIIMGSSVPEDRNVHLDKYYTKNRRISLSSLMKKPMRTVLVECEIKIPETGYTRREKIVYYPSEENSESILADENVALGLIGSVSSRYNADLSIIATLIITVFLFDCRRN